MRHRIIIGAMAAAAALVGCTADVDEPEVVATTTIETSTPTPTPEPSTSSPAETEAAPTPTATATTVELPPVTVAIDGCTSADEDLVDQVEQQLVDDAVALRLAFVDEYDNGMVAFGASIYGADGERVSSSDTWLVDGEQVWALSGSANEYTDWPDGRDLEEHYSAGDDVAGALQQRCLIPAIRQT